MPSHKTHKAKTISSLSLIVGASLTTPAAAYPIDCAILLCLAGGFPPSAECAAAKAVFIRRVTPFPIEPPLQIWSCPMGVAYRPQSTLPRAPLDFVLHPLTPDTASKLSLTFTIRAEQPAVYIKDGGAAVIPVQARPRGTISDPEFDFVRSIKVYQIEYEQHRTHDDCYRSDKSRIGTYDRQGGFAWADHTARVQTDTVINAERGDIVSHYSWDVPAIADINSLDPAGCDSINNRSIVVTWSDYFGKPGHHEVHY